mmetsp:Transcript_1876/g.3937  ORF Transcript_1876/g.3937 Transcript_1876/m.3937 type:complete len:234 (-) Transcript_1876:279-980(-)
MSRTAVRCPQIQAVEVQPRPHVCPLSEGDTGDGETNRALHLRTLRARRENTSDTRSNGSEREFEREMKEELSHHFLHARMRTLAMNPANQIPKIRSSKNLDCACLFELNRKRELRKLELRERRFRFIDRERFRGGRIAVVRKRNRKRRDITASGCFHRILRCSGRPACEPAWTCWLLQSLNSLSRGDRHLLQRHRHAHALRRLSPRHTNTHSLRCLSRRHRNPDTCNALWRRV